MATSTDQITCLSDLWTAAYYRRAVVGPTDSAWGKPRPATFVFNLPGAVIYRLIAAGMYVYQPKPKGKKCQPANQARK